MWKSSNTPARPGSRRPLPFWALLPPSILAHRSIWRESGTCWCLLPLKVLEATRNQVFQYSPEPKYFNINRRPIHSQLSYLCLTKPPLLYKDHILPWDSPKPLKLHPNPEATDKLAFSSTLGIKVGPSDLVVSTLNLWAMPLVQKTGLSFETMPHSAALASLEPPMNTGCDGAGP